MLDYNSYIYEKNILTNKLYNTKIKKKLKKIANFVRFASCSMYYLVFYLSFYFFGNYFMFKNFLNVLNFEQNETQNFFFENEIYAIIFFIFDIILSPLVLYLIFFEFATLFSFFTAIKSRFFLIKKLIINFVSNPKFKHFLMQITFGVFYIKVGMWENKVFFCIWTLYFIVSAIFKGYVIHWNDWSHHIRTRDKVFYKNGPWKLKFWVWILVVSLLIWTFYCKNVSKIAVNFWKINILVCIAVWLTSGNIRFMLFTSFFCYFFYVIPQIIALLLLLKYRRVGIFFLDVFDYESSEDKFAISIYGIDAILIRSAIAKENLSFKNVSSTFTTIYLRIFFFLLLLSYCQKLLFFV